MANQRILQGTSAVLHTVFQNQDGAAQDASGAVTVSVFRGNGTQLVATTAAVDASPVGRYEYTLTPAQTLLLDQLTVNWYDGGVLRDTTKVDVVGGYYFSIQEARDSDESLGNQAANTDAKIVRARQQVEEFCEAVTGRAAVPRYGRMTLAGSGLGTLPWAIQDLRSVRAVSLSGMAVSSSTLSGVVVSASRISFADGTTFPYGRGTVVIDYEYGLDSAPEYLKRACLVHLRHELHLPKSGINDRATNYVQEGGGSFVISQPGMRGAHTGIPYVDSAYDMFAGDRGDLVSVPILAGY